MKKIWIWNHYSTDTFIDKGGRHYWFAKYLARFGYKPIIFCASTIHNSNLNIDTKDNKFIIKTIDKIPYVFIKSPDYKGNGKKRIVNMISFYLNLFPVSKEYSDKYGKPDIILASSVHPLTLVAGIKTAKKYGIKCICEVRDLWPESFVGYGILNKNSLLLKILYAGEKWIYKKADKLVFTVEGGEEYIRERGWDKDNNGPIDLNNVYHINNGVDLEMFNYNKEFYQLADEDLDNIDIFKVVYTGSIRLVNKIEMLVDVAKQLRNTKIKFLIWGDGDQVNIIKQKIESEKLMNIVLKGKVDKKYIPNILSKADLNIITGETSELYKFGISPNKIFEYFAAGKPVLQTFKSKYSIVENNSAGFELAENTTIAIAECVEFFSKLQVLDYQSFCEHSFKTSKEYSFEKLTIKLIAIIENQQLNGGM